MYADVDLSIERVFTGNDVKYLHLGLSITDDSAAVRFSANLEDYLLVDIDSKMKFVPGGVNITLDTLFTMFNKFDLRNKAPLKIAYSPDEIKFNEFEFIKYILLFLNIFILSADQSVND